METDEVHTALQASHHTDERISRLQQEVALAVKYRPLEGSDSSYIAAGRGDKNCIENSYARRSRISEALPKAGLSALAQLFNSAPPGSKVQAVYRNRVHWNVGEQSWTQDIDGSFSSADYIFVIPCSKGWFASRMTYTINRSQNKCYFVRGDASQEAWTSYFYVAIWGADIVTVSNSISV